jgi:peroxiredoxin
VTNIRAKIIFLLLLPTLLLVSLQAVSYVLPKDPITDGFNLLALTPRAGVPAWDGVLIDTLGAPIHLTNFSGKVRLLFFFRQPVHFLAEHFSNLAALLSQVQTNRFAGLVITDQDMALDGVLAQPVISPSNSSLHLLRDIHGEVFRLYGVRQTPTWLLVDTNNIIIGEASGLRCWTNALSLFRALTGQVAAKIVMTNIATNLTLPSHEQTNQTGSDTRLLQILRQMDNTSLFY